MAENIEATHGEIVQNDGYALPPFLSEPAKEAKMEELAPAEIASLALASLSSGIALPAKATVENADIALPISETLLAAGKVLTERFRKEWKEDAEEKGLEKVDYPATGMRIQIVKSSRTPSATPEALSQLRKTDPILFSKIAKPGIHAPASKKKAIAERIDKLQAELLKLQAEKEAYDLYDEPELIDDEKAVAQALQETPWDGIEWTAKRKDSVREGSIPKKK